MNYQFSILACAAVIVFSTSAYSEIRSISEIDRDFFSSGAGNDYVFDSGDTAKSCNDFFEKFKSEGSPALNAGGRNKATYSSALSECLIQSEYETPKINSAIVGIEESKIDSLPELLPADFLLAISDESIATRSELIHEKRTLKQADPTIFYVKKDDESYLFKDGGGAFYNFTLFGSFEYADEGRLYVVNVENNLDGGSYNSSRYFILKKNNNEAFEIRKSIKVF
ncbi:hypothetical protein [Pseudomonas yamanorum]|uniref:hypothetical protein n=1 Tax=Pseudomonas yamanorum TaxID=515393 RepID=UPI002ECFBA66|nr:hypothetical protein VYI69_13490 [Pseudomonas yamanorum]